jgi:hypothetical protein
MSSASIEGVLPTAGMSVISGVVIRPSGRTCTLRAQFGIAPDEDRQLVQRADHVFLAGAFLHRHERRGRQLRTTGPARAAGQRQAEHGAAGKQAGNRIDGHRAFLLRSRVRNGQAMPWSQPTTRLFSLPLSEKRVNIALAYVQLCVHSGPVPKQDAWRMDLLNQHFQRRTLPQELRWAGARAIGSGAEHCDQIAHLGMRERSLVGQAVERGTQAADDAGQIRQLASSNRWRSPPDSCGGPQCRNCQMRQAGGASRHRRSGMYRRG